MMGDRMQSAARGLRAISSDPAAHRLAANLELYAKEPLSPKLKAALLAQVDQLTTDQ